MESEPPSPPVTIAKPRLAKPGVERPAAMPAATPAPQPGLHLLLDLPAEAAPLLRQTELVTGNAAKRPTTRRFQRVFWDTPELTIGRHGLALGILTIGRRKTQILRAIGPSSTGGRVRCDHESPLDGGELDLTRLAFAPGVDPALFGQVAAAALRPVFSITGQRTMWSILWRGTGLTLALESSTLACATGDRSICQLELGLTGGPLQGLHDFAQALYGAVRFTLATHDPEQQGYRAVAPADWRESTRTAIELDRDMTVKAGFLAIGRGTAALLRREGAALAEAADPGQIQPAQIHHLRVAIRRLRSILSIFGGALPIAARRSLARDLADFAARLGHTREWDVLKATTLAPLREALPDEPLVRELEFAAGVLRERTARDLCRFFAQPDFMALSLRIAAWFDAGIWPEAPLPDALSILDMALHAFARDVLKSRHKRLLRIGDGLADPQPAELHALRIEAKKLRYTCEAFRSLFPAKGVRRYLDTLRAIQEILGTLNDSFVARGLVGQLAGDNRDNGARAAGLIAGWTAAEVTLARRSFAESWRNFAEARRFWRED